jgi:hypothetical protein
MTVELVYSQESRNRHSLKCPEVNSCGSPILNTLKDMDQREQGAHKSLPQIRTGETSVWDATPIPGSIWGPKLGHFAGLSGVSLL